MAPGHHIPIEWLETFRIDDPEFGILLYMERRYRIIRKSECIRPCTKQRRIACPLQP